jgi:predicted TIM-barrel fold metal-dependent hydrolase
MLIAERPDRLVWGSNWPHPRRELTTEDNRELLGLVERWCPDAATRKAILVDNAAKLYDF